MASPAPAPSGGKFLGLRPRTALIVAGAALAAGAGYFWWRRRSSAKAGPSSASVTASAYGIDQSGELSVIQSELESLLAAEGQEPAAVASGGSSGGSGSPGGGSPGGSGGTQADNPPPPATGGKPKPAVPSGVHATRTTRTSVTLAWTKEPNAGSYRIRVTYQGRLVRQSVTAANSATISGLTPDHTYTFHVAAVGPGGVSGETSTAVKTAR